MKNIIIINGYGHLAQTIVTKLKIKDYYQPLIVEKDKIKADMAIENGCKVIYQDASNAQTIKLLYKKQKRNNIIAMLTLKSSDIDNIYFILNTKSIKIKSIIYTRINNIALSTQYQGTKVDGMIEPYSVVDNKAFNYLKKRSNLDNRHIYFFGYTNKNQHICKSLKNENIDLTIYEINENSYNLAKDDGFVNVILIDKHKTQIADINSSIVVCSMREEALNVYYALSLSTKKCDNEIIALSDSKEDNRKLLLAGVNKIFDVYSECASQFVEMIETNDKGRV
jgi:voltage-gated potassium channel